MKILILDILIFTVDFILFVYFAKVGLKTTDMTTRLICCVAMTYEIYLMMRFFKALKLKMKEQKDLK
ncbi:hypothetical protein [Intestinibacter bartlettii]|uniref:Uncharacterized protein n=1 Tax=Intestinibacter bartlettii TaxID=261299 RepID=A0ABS6DZK9_9FIRM|nr:hypothetical protein [Intestinibacter bartlettii]MBU5336843.1 hypothetical protein [Intestinibacter bartlettii]